MLAWSECVKCIHKKNLKKIFCRKWLTLPSRKIEKTSKQRSIRNMLMRGCVWHVIFYEISNVTFGNAQFFSELARNLNVLKVSETRLFKCCRELNIQWLGRVQNKFSSERRWIHRPTTCSCVVLSVYWLARNVNSKLVKCVNC